MSDKVKVEKGKLSQFRPATENANGHTPRGLGALGSAMGGSGYVAPMTAATDGEMIDGSARLEVAFDRFGDEAVIIRHDGKTPIVMIREDIPNAKTPEAKRIAYESNRVAELDLSWSAEQIVADLDAGIDLAGLWNDAELTELLEAAGSELLKENGAGAEAPEIGPDRAEELQAKWQVKPGDLWVIESKTGPGKFHRLLCGDCRNRDDIGRLCGEQKVSVFTSPPYAEQRKKQYGGVPTAEYVEWWEAVQDSVKSVLAEDGSFFVNIKAHCEDGQRVLYVFDLVLAMVRRWGWRFVDELCWVNGGYPGNFSPRFKNGFEPVYHFSSGGAKHRPGNVRFKMTVANKRKTKWNREKYGGLGRYYSPTGSGTSLNQSAFDGSFALPSNVLEIPADRGFLRDEVVQDIHSATFPTTLPAFFIKAYSDPGDSWLDPFAGSGTVGIACERESRLSLLCEVLPKYCAVILERFQQTFDIEPALLSE